MEERGELKSWFELGSSVRGSRRKVLHTKLRPHAFRISLRFLILCQQRGLTLFRKQQSHETPTSVSLNGASLELLDVHCAFRSLRCLCCLERERERQLIRACLGAWKGRSTFSTEGHAPLFPT